MKTLLKTLETIKHRKELYSKENSRIAQLQGDFPTYLTAIDTEIESAIVKYLDEQIEEICGLTELASYYLYEVNNKRGKIYCRKSDREFKVRNVEDLEKVINYFKEIK